MQGSTDHPFFLPVHRFQEVQRVLGISPKKFQDLKKIFSDTPLFKGTMPKPYGNKKNWTLLSKFEVLLLSVIEEIHHAFGIPYSKLKVFAVLLFEKIQAVPDYLDGKVGLYLKTDLKENLDVEYFNPGPLTWKGFTLIFPLDHHLSKLQSLKKTGVEK